MKMKPNFVRRSLVLVGIGSLTLVSLVWAQTERETVPERELQRQLEERLQAEEELRREYLQATRRVDELRNPLHVLPEAQRAFVSRKFPMFVELMQQLQQERSAEALHELREYQEAMTHHLAELMGLKREFPDGYELKKILIADFNCERLSEQIQQLPTGKERDQHVEKLKSLVEAAFELKQKQRKMEAEQIERELQEIRSLIQKRDQHRAIIVGRRLQELSGQHDLYEW